MIDDIKDLSKQTWDKLKLLELHLDKLNEEGFTQDLIYTILKSSSSLIAIDTSVTESEKTTGADFFWDLDINNTTMRKLAIQAKRVYPITVQHNSGYSSLNYKFKPQRKRLNLKFDYQHELLENFCNNTPYEAHYILYNTLFSRNTVQTIDNQRASGSDTEFDHGSETQEIFGITIAPLGVITRFMRRSTRNHYLFTELLYEDGTLSLAEFLRNSQSGPGTGGSGPGTGGSGPGTGGSGPGTGGSGPNNPNTNDFNNLNSDNQSDKEFNDSVYGYHKLQSTVRNNIVYLYSHDNVTTVENRINIAEKSFHELQILTQEKNIEQATKIYGEMSDLYFDKNTRHSGTFREFSSILEQEASKFKINLENVKSLMQEIKDFQKRVNTEGEKAFYREMKRETLKMLTFLEAKPKYLISTDLN